MQKWACGLTYLGSQYHGWQKQPTIAETVEAKVVEALSSVASHPVDIICAGRTDAGVHALNQVIHFSSDADRKPDNWLLGANRELPVDIKLQWVVPVDDDFHARYSATSRRYCYVIYNAPLSHPWLEGRVVWLPRRLLHIEGMLVEYHLRSKAVVITLLAGAKASWNFCKACTLKAHQVAFAITISVAVSFTEPKLLSRT